MITKLLPVLLAVIGIAGGAGAGYVLRPAPAPEAGATAADGHASGKPPASAHGGARGDGHGSTAAPGEESEFVKLDHQFVVPVLSNGRVISMVAMSLTLDLEPGIRNAVIARQPLLRDRFLRVLMDHANTGGFDGTFTSNGALGALKSALIDAGNTAIGSGVKDVLILDVARQEV